MLNVLHFFVFKLVLVTKPTCDLAAEAAGWGPCWMSPFSTLWSEDLWVSFTELSDGWHDHGKTPFNPPHCLQLEKQTERGSEKKDWSYFLLFVWFWNSRRVTVSGSSASTTTVYFSEHEINYRKEERKKNWVRQACVCVWEIETVSVLFGLLSSYHFFLMLYYFRCPRHWEAMW